MRFFHILGFALIIFFIGCSDDSGTISADSVSGEAKKFEKKRDFELRSADGKMFNAKITDDGVSIKELSGKVVIVDFFATWCPPCRAEAPHLVNLQEKYDGNMTILGMLMEKDSGALSNLERFKEEFGTNYPVITGESPYEFSRALGGVPSIPYMIIYDGDGKYVNHYIGAVPEEMLEMDIKKSLDKK